MLSGSDAVAELVRPPRHLFLSPHYDDIPLSAGGTVRLLASHGRAPETLIVFGSEPDPARPLTPFARRLHEQWGFTAAEVIARRQAEERAASAVIGAKPRLLPFRDAIYREDHYLSDDDLFGRPADAEGALPDRLIAALDLPSMPNPNVRLYAPLAIGRHVDHQLVQRAGMLLARQGWDVWFYEDIPYALKPGAFAARLAEIEQTMEKAPVARIPVQSTWEAKIDGILRYPSQLETIFRNYVGVGTSREEISEALQAYAREAGEGEFVERFWKMKYASSREGS